MSNGTSEKSGIACLLFLLLLSPLGFHRFYVGKVGTGVLFLLTMGGPDHSDCRFLHRCWRQLRQIEQINTKDYLGASASRHIKLNNKCDLACRFLMGIMFPG
ncbi:MAG: TM2 domain-containing protein [Planctomycetota bacterium]|jgi:TM2 domain-containing membrane protein YozV